MSRKYYKTRKFRRKANKLLMVTMMLASCASGFVLGATLPDNNNVETVELVEVSEVRVISESEDIASTTPIGKSIGDMGLTAGIASVINGIETSELSAIAAETVAEMEKSEIDVQIIRCTGYCDYGVTKSGEYVRDGIIAGKKEWLGRTCNLYRVNDDNSIGELIGSYEFLDTGYGIDVKTSNGVKGSLELGKSVDVWHPSEEAVWEWVEKYGDYVYIEFTS